MYILKVLSSETAYLKHLSMYNKPCRATLKLNRNTVLYSPTVFTYSDVMPGINIYDLHFPLLIGRCITLLAEDSCNEDV